jgi:5-methylcytosine-specific restriction protein A
MIIADYFIPADDEHIRREKARARELRNSPWWKRRRSSGVCHYCGKQFKPAELTMDHLIPLARGGKSIRANVVPSCKDCNNKKKYLLPMEWEEYLSNLRKEE